MAWEATSKKQAHLKKRKHVRVKKERETDVKAEDYLKKKKRVKTEKNDSEHEEFLTDEQQEVLDSMQATGSSGSHLEDKRVRVKKERKTDVKAEDYLKKKKRVKTEKNDSEHEEKFLTDEQQEVLASLQATGGSGSHLEDNVKQMVLDHMEELGIATVTFTSRYSGNEIVATQPGNEGGLNVTL